MRIMMVTTLYSPWVGGLEILVQQLTRELSQRGHDLLVVTSHGEEAESGPGAVDGTPVLRVPVHRAIEQGDPANLFRVRRDLARAAGSFAPDLVHAHDAGPVLWWYLRTPRRVPLVVTQHNVRAHYEDSLDLVTTMLTEADWVTGVSQDVVDDVVATAPEAAAKSSVIRNGIDPPLTTFSPVPVDPPRLACIGRLVPQKGFDLAVDAVAALAPRHPTLRLTGAGDGPERDHLFDRAAELGVASRVEFLGTVSRPEVGRLIERTTAVVMPSRYEGLPLVAIEAAWAARPIVATRAPGLGQAVVDGETALVVEPDADALAHGIERILADPFLARRLGAGARALAEREYSIAACADAYESLYVRLVGGETPAARYDPVL